MYIHIYSLIYIYIHIYVHTYTYICIASFWCHVSLDSLCSSLQISHGTRMIRHVTLKMSHVAHTGALPHDLSIQQLKDPLSNNDEISTKINRRFSEVCACECECVCVCVRERERERERECVCVNVFVFRFSCLLKFRGNFGRVMSPILLQLTLQHSATHSTQCNNFNTHHTYLHPVDLFSHF